MLHLLRFLIFLITVLPLSAWAAEPRLAAAGIASAHPLATQAGHEILAHGGNAFDAAVAVAATLAVVEPYNSGLGGGGFFLLHRARDGFEIMIDARERAPLAATRDMYLDRDGRSVPGRSIDGVLAAGIPGTPAGLVHLAEKYGRLPLKQSLAPAIRLARDGFPVTAQYGKMCLRQHDRLENFPETARVFFHDGFIYGAGEKLRQPELARTLERLAAAGREGFYDGDVAKRLVDGVRVAGGLWSLKDLTDYRVIEREPVRGVYRNVRVTSAALPSSGGVVLVQILNLLQGLDLDSMDKPRRDQTVIEAMRLAYRDRARYLGDPDFVNVDVARLIDPAYAAKLREEMPALKPASAAPAKTGEGGNTTHLSVIDRDGNRVAVTLSLNTPFGSGFMPPGTGVVLNNEMDDFAVKPDAPNNYGLTGSNANAIAPGKRPLSSMTPTFLENDDTVVVLGTPGGSRIISMVLLATLEFAHGRGGPKDWASLPRFHHQYSPDVVEYEPPAFDDAEKRALQQRGYRLEAVRGGYGNMQAVVWNKKTGGVEATSDPRGEGFAQVK
ncbi:MAG: gamma-glutamyltransferase [Gammaproteobacteria bacterium]|nr:gamma-glutamyltransferase [Gammaproteobacteria bacterium]